MVEGRAGQHQPVQQGDGDADVHTRPQPEPAAGGPVQEHRLPDPRVAGRDDEGLAVDHEPDVADEALVEDGVHGGPVVGRPLGQAPGPGPLGRLVAVSVHVTLQYISQNVLVQYQGDQSRGNGAVRTGVPDQMRRTATRRSSPAVPALVAALALLVACQGSPEVGRTAPPGSQRVELRIALPAEPWAVLAEPTGLWVVLSDRTLARYDPATARLEAAPVRLPFTPGALVAGHGDLWIGGQVDGRRRITAEGNYPVIQLARVDPRRRAVTAVIPVPMRSNGNRLVSTSNAVWVTDPAEGPLSRIWRVDPATNRLLRPPLRGGDGPRAPAALHGAAWRANHDDGTL